MGIEFKVLSRNPGIGLNAGDKLLIRLAESCGGVTAPEVPGHSASHWCLVANKRIYWGYLGTLDKNMECTTHYYIIIGSVLGL